MTKKQLPSGPEGSGRSWRVLAKRASGDFSIENEGVLDEVVLDDWLHLEKMHESLWWLRIGNARLLVELCDDGTVELAVERDFYENSGASDQ